MNPCIHTKVTAVTKYNIWSGQYSNNTSKGKYIAAPKVMASCQASHYVVHSVDYLWACKLQEEKVTLKSTSEMQGIVGRA